MKVFFFDNGNTCVFDEEDKQVASLNEPWLLLYAKFLENSGIDPTEHEFKMPNMRVARIFKTDDDNYNWRIEDEG